MKTASRFFFCWSRQHTERLVIYVNLAVFMTGLIVSTKSRSARNGTEAEAQAFGWPT